MAYHQAAPGVVEAMRRIETDVRQCGYELVRRQFSENEWADLTPAIVTINGWNRLAIALRAAPETCQPERA